MYSPRLPTRTARSFDELYEELENDEKDFFDLLEHELNKVEDFYTAREKDAVHRAHELRDQLHELAEHRRIYHELYPNGLPDWEANIGRILPGQIAQTGLAGVAHKLHLRVPFLHEDDPKANGANGNALQKSPSGEGNDARRDRLRAEMKADDARRDRLREEMKADKDHQTYSPERYQRYKKELKAAVLEFYRQSELIKNYRVRRPSKAYLMILRS